MQLVVVMCPSLHTIYVYRIYAAIYGKHETYKVYGFSRLTITTVWNKYAIYIYDSIRVLCP